MPCPSLLDDHPQDTCDLQGHHERHGDGYPERTDEVRRPFVEDLPWVTVARSQESTAECEVDPVD